MKGLIARPIHLRKYYRTFLEDVLKKQVLFVAWHLAVLVRLAAQQ